MFDLKPISRDAIPAALEKAERYRLLNEPEQAESICLDVLAVDADNQPAVVALLLALTEQFGEGSADRFHQAEALIAKLRGDYEAFYYHGILWERRAYARAMHQSPGSATVAYAWIKKAMEYFEKAEKVRPAGNDDAILRWNSCVRLCERFDLHPEAEVAAQPVLGDD
jgi:hypothetical protein